VGLALGHTVDHRIVCLCRVPGYAERGGDALVSKVPGLDRSA
jgi:hypothetical protein